MAQETAATESASEQETVTDLANEIIKAFGGAPVPTAPLITLARQGYILMESSTEYNDEYHSLLDGGDPVFVYFDVEEANAEAERRNAAWAAEQDADDYDEPLDELAMFYVLPVKVET